jgi:hypothetical protein
VAKYESPNLVEIYETPEVFELGQAEELTLGCCGCYCDCGCGGKHAHSEGEDIA